MSYIHSKRKNLDVSLTLHQLITVDVYMEQRMSFVVHSKGPSPTSSSSKGGAISYIDRKQRSQKVR